MMMYESWQEAPLRPKQQPASSSIEGWGVGGLLISVIKMTKHRWFELAFLLVNFNSKVVQTGPFAVVLFNKEISSLQNNIT